MSKYIDADLLRKEIEREMGEITYGVGEPKDVYTFCGELLAFIKSLPEQPVEGLEEEMDEMWLEYCEDVDYLAYSSIARHFAEWGAEHLNGWHSVEESLPEMDEEVIVLRDKQNTGLVYEISFGHLVDTERCIDYNGWNVPGVKFWMPMPKIPEEK